MKRRHAGVAFDVWLSSPEGESCSSTTTLNAPAMQGYYLRNRLYRAFMAGWRAAEAEARKKRRTKP